MATLNCLHELVRKHLALQEAREALQDDLHRAKVRAGVRARARGATARAPSGCPPGPAPRASARAPHPPPQGDVKTAGRTIDRLRAASQAKEQEVGGLNIKLRQLDAWYREEADRWAGERDELARKVAQLEQRAAQWTHELRRRDAEFERLQKHLGGQLARRSSATASSGGGATGSSGGGAGRSAGGARVSGPGRSQAGSGGGLDTRRMTKAELEDAHKVIRVRMPGAARSSCRLPRASACEHP